MPFGVRLFLVDDAGFLGLQQHLCNQLLALALDCLLVALADALVERQLGVCKLEDLLFDCVLGNQSERVSLLIIIGNGRDIPNHLDLTSLANTMRPVTSLSVVVRVEAAIENDNLVGAC